MVMFHCKISSLGMRNVSLFWEYGSYPHPTALPVYSTWGTCGFSLLFL